MELHDMNQSWTPPDGYRFVNIKAEGAFLVALFAQQIFWAGTTVVKGENFITIFLNDMGREVSRTQHRVDFAPPAEPFVLPDTRRFHFWHGWYSIRDGLQEMIKCLR